MTSSESLRNPILGRHVSGDIAFTPRTFAERQNALKNRIKSLAEHGGGILLIPFAEQDEPAVRLELSTLYGGLLLDQDPPVELFNNRTDPYMSFRWPGQGHLLVHHLTRRLDILERWWLMPPDNGVLIATVPLDEIGLLPDTIVEFADPVNSSTDHRSQEEELERGWQTYARLTKASDFKGLQEDVAELYRCVALFHAWGVPMPIDWLARVTQYDVDDLLDLLTVIQPLDLLFVSEDLPTPDVLVTTSSPGIARSIMARILIETVVPAKTHVEEQYTQVLSQVNSDDRTERYTLFKVIQAMSQSGYLWSWVQAHWQIQATHQQWTTSLLTACGTPIQQCLQRGDAVEQLLWGKFFENRRDMKTSLQIFDTALSQAPRNRSLLHARARMLGAWARIDALQYARARNAFDVASQHDRTNPYIYQSWGVMEAECGHPDLARIRFEAARKTASREVEHLYTLVAWANMELEIGQYESARRLLDMASGLSPDRVNPHRRHLEARLAWYQGDIHLSLRTLQALIDDRSSNIHAMHTLGDIAATRGHWASADAWFQRILTLDPGNRHARHALAVLAEEKAEQALRRRAETEARQQYEQADTLFRQLIADDEALNKDGADPVTLTAYAVYLGKRAQFENRLEHASEATALFADAEQRLRRVLIANPGNIRAAHALGELKRRQGQFAEAGQAFQEVCNREPENIPALLSLAEMKLEQTPADITAAIRYLYTVGAVVATAKPLKNGDQSDPAAVPNPSLTRHEGWMRLYTRWAAIERRCSYPDQALKRINEALDGNSAFPGDRENVYAIETQALIFDDLNRPTDAAECRRKAQGLRMHLQTGH